MRIGRANVKKKRLKEKRKKKSFTENHCTYFAQLFLDLHKIKFGFTVMSDVLTRPFLQIPPNALTESNDVIQHALKFLTK